MTHILQGVGVICFTFCIAKSFMFKGESKLLQTNMEHNRGLRNQTQFDKCMKQLGD